MRRTPAPALVSAAIAGLLLVAQAREARACGVGFGWFGGSGSGGLWQRPPRDPAPVPETIVLMGNEALGIPPGIEVDLSEPPPEAENAIARLLDGLRGLVALAPSR
jgi:hypothetical protein